MVLMSQKNQRFQGDLIVENVSTVKWQKTAGAVRTASKEYAGSSWIVPVTFMWNNLYWVYTLTLHDFDSESFHDLPSFFLSFEGINKDLTKDMHDACKYDQ